MALGFWEAMGLGGLGFLNQDGWDERMDQDHFGNVALEIPQNFRGLLHKPASCF